MKLELAYDGKFGSKELTPEMLSDVVETFGEQGSIPVVKGHSPHWFDDSLPAEGWINEVELQKKDGKNYLIASDIELLEPLKQEYAEGKYKNWSIGISRDYKIEEKEKEDGTKEITESFSKWYLFHLAMLGATLPAIPRLKEIQEQMPAMQIAASKEISGAYVFSGKDVKRESIMFSFSMPHENKSENKSETLAIGNNTNNSKEGDTMEIEKLTKEKEELSNALKAKETSEKELLSKLEKFEAEKKAIEEKAFSDSKANLEKAMKEKAINEALSAKLFEAKDLTGVYSVIAEVLSNCGNKLDGGFEMSKSDDMKEYDHKELQKRHII